MSPTGKVIILAAVMLGLVGCSSTPIAMNYAPSSTMSLKGSEQVGAFDYVPADSGKVKPNQIRTTAIGNFLLEKPVDKYFEQALLVESRFVGINVGTRGPEVHGAINEFLVDDLGYSVDWTLDVTYVVDGKDNTTCYQQNKTTKKHTAKFGVRFDTLNEVVKQNIQELFADPSFVACINRS